nr:MAG TPA: hypothetical protein [Caudoviricetes sp.]
MIAKSTVISFGETYRLAQEDVEEIKRILSNRN